MARQSAAGYHSRKIMGIKFGLSSCSEQTARSASTAPNPNKFRFEPLSWTIKGQWVLAEVQYPDATTYEGRKLLLFKEEDWNRCLARNEMDPHFLPDQPTPIARFKPDALGRELAEMLLSRLAE